MIPVYITLQYEANVLKFPINPECIEKTIASNSMNVNVVGMGEVSIPTTPALATLNIKSFFWQDKNILPADSYINWLNKWQQSKKPANLIITKLNYSMKVTCESFRYWVNAGEETDRYFELQLKEYRPYGAVYLNMASNASLLEKLQKLYDLATPPVLVEFPRSTRANTSKAYMDKTYTTKACDTILTITKKLTGGEDWEKLYDENRLTLGDYVADGKEIPAGTELTVPEEWTA